MILVVRQFVIAGLALLCLGPADAAAQQAALPRFAISAGLDWLGRADMGGADATLTEIGRAHV